MLHTQRSDFADDSEHPSTYCNCKLQVRIPISIYRIIIAQSSLAFHPLSLSFLVIGRYRYRKRERSLMPAIIDHMVAVALLS